MRRSTLSLYERVMQDAATAPLSTLMPSVLRFAREIGDGELEKWARLELEGYVRGNPALTEDVVIPEYREVTGEHCDEMGRVLLLTDPELQFTNSTRVRWGVAELEQLAQRSSPIVIRDPHIAAIIRRYLEVEVTRFTFSPTALQGVLSSIGSNLISKLQDAGTTLEGYRVDEPASAGERSRIRRVLAALGNHIVTTILGLLSALLVAYLAFRFGWV